LPNSKRSCIVSSAMGVLGHAMVDLYMPQSGSVRRNARGVSSSGMIGP
jgi:hypothetical protein